MSTIIALDTHDVRFPTSRELDGSDAMNPDPDYSAAYVVLRTDAPDDLAGYGLVFTIGRGNDVQTAAVAALAEHVVGLSVEEVIADLGAFARRLTNDSQLRWLGPEKGVMHMAIGAVINAAWDLAARAAKAAVALHRRAQPGTAGRHHRLPLPHRRAHPRRSAGNPARCATAACATHRHADRTGLSRLHHLARLARLLR